MIGEVNKGFGYKSIGKIKDKRVQWLIENILCKGVLAFITGQAKAGKTTIAIELALSLTTGKPFLGEYKTKKSKVLYFALEDHQGELKAKVKHMLKGKGFPKNFYMSNAVAINLATNMDKIRDDIEKSKADVVIFDTFSRSHENDENSSSDMAPILNKIREEIRNKNITILIVHHTGHKVEKPNYHGNWLRGSSAFNGEWENLLCIKQEPNGVVKMKVFHRYRPGFDCSYTRIQSEELDMVSDSYPITELRYIDENAEETAMNEEIVLKALMECPKSGNELTTYLKKSKVSRTKIDIALKRLDSKSRIFKAGKGKNTRWHAKL